MEEHHFKAPLFRPDDHTVADFSSWHHHTPVAVVPVALPGGMPVPRNSRRMVDFCNRNNRQLVQNASAPDNGAAQNNNSQVEMALHVPCVQAPRAVLTVAHPEPMQDCPAMEEWPAFRQLAG
jgi:uncharacterized protein YbbK (DUF523 family)